jgi:hypothetical protein
MMILNRGYDFYHKKISSSPLLTLLHPSACGISPSCSVGKPGRGERFIVEIKSINPKEKYTPPPCQGEVGRGCNGEY